MKKRGKNVKLTLLLSAVLIGTNVCYAYAQETSLSGMGSVVREADETKGDMQGQAELTDRSEETTPTDKTEMTDQPGTTAPTDKPETADQSGTTTPTDKTESTDQTEPTTPTDKTESTDQTEPTTPTDKTESTDQTEPTTPTDKTESTDQTEPTTPTDKTETTDQTEPTTPPDQTDETGGAENTPSSGEDTEIPDAETDSGETEDMGDQQDDAEDTSAAEDIFVNQNGETVKPSDLIGVDYTTIADSYDGIENVLKQYVISEEHAENTIMNSYVDENGNLIMVISQGQGSETAGEQSGHGDSGLGALLSTAPAPSIDGSFSGWDDIPISYEYNWDNSQNCWQWGEWAPDPVTGENTCYKTEEGTYDNNVRHAMQLYSDGENVYLKITYATIYGAHANSEAYQFSIDGVKTQFQVTWADGTPLTGTSTAPGTYVVDVRNGDSGISYSIVDGASAFYRVTETGVNNQLELKIPMEAFKAQNGDVNLDNFNVIEFFTPNLMYQSIKTAGSSTGAEPFAAAAFLLIPAGYVWMKKKDREEMAFA